MSLWFPVIRRFIVVRMLLARPRLVWSALFGALVILALPHVAAMHDVTRYIVGWNAGAWLYLALVAWMMFGPRQQQIRHWARLEDEGQWLVMLLVVLAAIASLAAIVLELAVVKDMKGWLRGAHILLAVLTLLSSWAFTHVMFALHYARAFYAEHARGGSGGLEFPGTRLPDYADFLYFAFIIGTSGQTADVSFTDSRQRRAGTAHCVLSFFFNATVLALMINIAAGLI
ncbi:DUF1345 domain-containing protein [Chromobacterium subtsugae]|uniref:DUF1345 domain-containing protein n=1 Tax=Chromobacterium subtsugae TaxID=251747 RepID=A0ABS7FCP3_9NEIS|nr:MULTISPECIES: DUF1345 domain-containing protein [Chromobacterium]KUM05661.1 hypothetical protein Cv017_07855 [Chromobacterium subtsugae]KZE87172.1 hypothetical protein AWB61_12560 [Chromobacterium sp. F49]MBW7565881.1 DUF1345 domain-containing protein [Chromobacterium subtsugae]MBW8287079.1 DUF1345 domain-containing protein [Chromobacterium subtsugae]WSE93156.1 DUF1345 domain-containing protein [Chromobacterium subtsugae]